MALSSLRCGSCLCPPAACLAAAHQHRALPVRLRCCRGRADFSEILARYGVPGAGRLGDPADTIPAGWQYDPSRDKANRASKAWALKVAQQPEQQQQQPEQPNAAHEAVMEAAHAAVQADGPPAGTASDRAAAVDAAAEAAAAAHVAASEAAAAGTPADQQPQQQQPQQQQQPTIQLGGSGSGRRVAGRVSAASLDMRPAATPSPPAAPATEIDGSTVRHRARVGATAAVIGGACGAVVAVSLCLVAIRIRQRRAAGFRALPAAERLRDELPAALAPIPEQESLEDVV